MSGGMLYGGQKIYRELDKSAGDSSYRRRHRRRQKGSESPSRFRRPRVRDRWKRRKIRERSPGLVLTRSFFLLASAVGGIVLVGALVALGWDELTFGELVFSVGLGGLVAGFLIVLGQSAAAQDR